MSEPTCGESATIPTLGDMGPCIHPAGHDGPWHEGAGGEKWRPNPASIINIPEPMTEEQVAAIHTTWNEHHGQPPAGPAETIARLRERAATAEAAATRLRLDHERANTAQTRTISNLRQELAAVRAVLREVLGAFRKETITHGPFSVLGYRAPHPIHPDDYDRWQAALNGEPPAAIDWATVQLTVDDRTPPRPIATELLDDADPRIDLGTWGTADVPAALRGPNCPRPPEDTEPLRKLAEQAIPDPPPIWHGPIDSYRTWEQVDADPPHFTGLLALLQAQASGEADHAAAVEDAIARVEAEHGPDDTITIPHTTTED